MGNYNNQPNDLLGNYFSSLQFFIIFFNFIEKKSLFFTNSPTKNFPGV
jgi:hypothetical protein